MGRFVLGEARRRWDLSDFVCRSCLEKLDIFLALRGCTGVGCAGGDGCGIAVRISKRLMDEKERKGTNIVIVVSAGITTVVVDVYEVTGIVVMLVETEPKVIVVVVT